MPIKIVSRAEWGAAPPKGTPQHEEWPKGVDLWVHHTAGPQNESMRAIQAFHQNVRGWNDIGYNYAIRFDGTIYEGRGFEIHGAHSPGKNHEPAVVLIGDYSKIEPSDAQHRAVYALKDFLQAGKLRGHRENTATSCPGDAAYAKIVKGPPPKPEPKPLTYWFEQLKNGKAVRTWGPYQRKLKRDVHYAAVKCGHPKFILRKYSK